MPGYFYYNYLRKLIKYEERLGSNTHNDDYFEGLFRRTTASYRAKIDKENALKNAEIQANPGKRVLDEKGSATGKTSSSTFRLKSSETIMNQLQPRRMMISEQNRRIELKCKDSLDNAFDGTLLDKKKKAILLNKNDNFLVDQSARNISALPTTGIRRKLVENYDEPAWVPPLGTSSSLMSRSRSTGRSGATSPKAAQSKGSMQKSTKSRSSERQADARTYTARSGSVLIPKPRPPKYGNKRPGNSDPVKLYHYYQREWKHFQNQIPGEKTRADVRWQIRQKLLDPK